MRWVTSISVWMLILVLCSPASAALLIEQRSTEDGTGEAITSYIHGLRMRVGGPNDAQFTLVDWGGKTMYTIDVAAREAIDFSAGLKQDAAARRCPEPQVEAVLEHIGAGPKIAGYATEHYVLKADGKPCQEIYASKKTLEIVGEWLEMAGKANAFDDDAPGRSRCDIAQDHAVDLRKIGWPMKTVTLSGPGKGEADEVLRLERVSLPAAFFEIPSGFEVMTLDHLYPGLNQAGGSGAVPELQCPSVDDDYYDDDDYDADEGDGADEGYFGDPAFEDEALYDEADDKDNPSRQSDGLDDSVRDGADEAVEDTVKDTMKGLFDGLKKGLGG